MTRQAIKHNKCSIKSLLRHISFYHYLARILFIGSCVLFIFMLYSPLFFIPCVIGILLTIKVDKKGTELVIQYVSHPDRASKIHQLWSSVDK